MQSDSESLSCIVPSRSTLPFDEASTTLWTRDTDAEQVTDRVIWQASQPQDPVLRQLMNDAASSRRAPCIVQTKSWSPSSSFFTNDASTSKITTSENPSRVHRPFKRRASNTNVAQREASPGLCENSLDKHIQKFVALLPVISKKIDENVKREEEALRRRRRKEKKARRIRDGSSMMKKEWTDSKGKQRADEGVHIEEELTAVEESSAFAEANPGHPFQRRGHSGILQGISSSPVVPLCKSWSAEGTVPSHTGQRAGRQAFSNDAEAFPELPSFRPSSFVATSTPQPCAGTNASRSPSPEQVIRMSREMYPGSMTANNAIDAYPATQISGAAGSQPQIYTPTPPTQVVHPSLNPPPKASPAQLNPPPSGNPSTTYQIPSLPRPKSSGPPVLGMRRLPNSQAPYLSQNRNLPSKQDKFKVPFAKPKVEPDNTTSQGAWNLTGSASASRSFTPRKSNERRRDSSSIAAIPASFSSAATVADAADEHEHPSGAVTQDKQASSTPPSVEFHIGNGSSTTTSRDRSVPVPEDPDSTFDYDMDIDLDELEKACSMYD